MNKNNQLIIFVLVVVAATLSRLMPHLPNFTPIGALALFGSAYYTDKRIGLIIAFSAMLLSDLVIGFHSGMFFVYGAFALIAFMGTYLFRNGVSIPALGAGAFAASVLFYLITNFGVWAASSMYTKDLNGLLTCFTLAIPFFWNTLAGDVVYLGVLFGVYQLVNWRTPAVSENSGS